MIIAIGDEFCKIIYLLQNPALYGKIILLNKIGGWGMMKKLLVTGFEPFGGDLMNSSWEAVRALPEKIGSVSVEKLCLPVVFGKAAGIVIEKALDIDADGIICVGQAGGRDRITPEARAVNLREARIPDNDGNSPMGEKICTLGKDAEFSTFNTEKFVRELSLKGIPTAVSEDAGRYVCNDLLYSLLHRFSGTGVKCTFIHVPYFEGQDVCDKPVLPLDVIREGLLTAVECAVREDMADYDILCDKLASLTDGVPYETANLANAAALLYETLPDVNWAGFYMMQDGALVLGPFCGRPACIKIPVGRGVCGTAAERRETLVVPDVHEVPGHIACDGASNSEIVVPLMRGGEVVGVLDIDSPLFERFSEHDKAGLERFAGIIEKVIGGGDDK